MVFQLQCVKQNRPVHMELFLTFIFTTKLTYQILSQTSGVSVCVSLLGHIVNLGWSSMQLGIDCKFLESFLTMGMKSCFSLEKDFMTRLHIIFQIMGDCKWPYLINPFSVVPSAWCGCWISSRSLSYLLKGEYSQSMGF